MDSEPKSRVVHENLDTTFVNLWALLRNLSQRGFIGRVRVELKDYTADVFMTGSSTPLVHEIDHAAGTDTLEEAALHRLVLRVRETPGTISVFEGPDEAVAVQSTPTLQPERAEDDSPARDLPLEPPAQITANIQLSGDENADNEVSENQLSALNSGAASGEAQQEISEEQSPAPPIAIVEPVPTVSDAEDEIEWDAIIQTSGELIGAVERAVSGSGADFASLFNAARLELADDYTFLDPMSGAFSYAKSIVNLNGEVPNGAYAIGLSEALRRVVDGVAKGERARRVRERVALEMFSVARKRNEILARSGFLTQLDRIAGTKVI
jgi:hypothetical protein